jgi:hypothetical protein
VGRKRSGIESYREWNLEGDRHGWNAAAVGAQRKPRNAGRFEARTAAAAGLRAATTAEVAAATTATATGEAARSRAVATLAGRAGTAGDCLGSARAASGRGAGGTGAGAAAVLVPGAARAERTAAPAAARNEQGRGLLSREGARAGLDI